MDIYQGPPNFSVWRFGLYSPNQVFYRKMTMISNKALISGYFEPKKLRARPPNKAATPLSVKNIEFPLRGRGEFVWGPSPSLFGLQVATYWGFIRYYCHFSVEHLVWAVQAVKFEQSKKTSVLVIKWTFLSIVQFWRLVQPKPHVLQKNCINIDWSHNCYLEPKKLRASPPNKATMPSWMKLDLFFL